MARLGLTAEARGQFAALARLQWQAFLNTSFRTIRNRLELLARIPLALVFASFGLGGAVGLGAGAWYFVHGGRPEYLAALLWPVFAFWQLFPIVASAFTEQFDSSHLLRFPLSFRSYVLVRLAYGLFDPVPAVGALWLLGIAIGTGIGRPLLFPWTVLVLLVFAAFNIILTRMIFSWAERWLARRRTREILSILLFLCLLGFQFSGPLVQRFTGRSSVHVRPLMTEAAHVQRVLPPGLAAEAVAVAARGEPAAAVAYSAGLGVCLAAVGWLLGLRLHAEYRGESLSEAGARPVRRTTRPKVRRGWPAAGLPGPVVAVFEKEIRGFMRSPPLIVILLMPLVVLALVLFGSGGAAHSDAPAFMAHTPDLALPIGAAYALVLLTNLSHNAFGAEGSGVQIFFVTPVAFRRIALGKNLAHGTIIALQIALIWLAVAVLHGPPSHAITAVTVAALCFAMPLEFSVGNVLSLWFPKRIDYSRFGRQRASRITVLAGMLVHSLVVGIAALTVFAATMYVGLWAAVPLLLVLTALTVSVYLLVAARLDSVALGRRETIISELSRTEAS